MLNLDVKILLLLVSFMICCAVSLRLFLLKCKTKKTVETLSSTRKSLDTLQDQYQQLQNKNQNSSFDSTLQKAELTTHLQKSRSQYHKKAGTILPPERYKYIRSLMENGLDSSGIASVLAISVQEAEQLVALSRLSRRKEVSLSEN